MAAWRQEASLALLFLRWRARMDWVGCLGWNVVMAFRTQGRVGAQVWLTCALLFWCPCGCDRDLAGAERT